MLEVGLDTLADPSVAWFAAVAFRSVRRRFSGRSNGGPGRRAYRRGGSYSGYSINGRRLSRAEYRDLKNVEEELDTALAHARRVQANPNATYLDYEIATDRLLRASESYHRLDKRLNHALSDPRKLYVDNNLPTKKEIDAELDRVVKAGARKLAVTTYREQIRRLAPKRSGRMTRSIPIQSRWIGNQLRLVENFPRSAYRTAPGRGRRGASKIGQYAYIVAHNQYRQGYASNFLDEAQFFTARIVYRTMRKYIAISTIFTPRVSSSQNDTKA